MKRYSLILISGLILAGMSCQKEETSLSNRSAKNSTNTKGSSGNQEAIGKLTLPDGQIIYKPIIGFSGDGETGSNQALQKYVRWTFTIGNTVVHYSGEDDLSTGSVSLQSKVPPYKRVSFSWKSTAPYNNGYMPQYYTDYQAGIANKELYDQNFSKYYSYEMLDEETQEPISFTDLGLQPSDILFPIWEEMQEE